MNFQISSLWPCGIRGSYIFDRYKNSIFKQDYYWSWHWKCRLDKSLK